MEIDNEREDERIEGEVRRLYPSFFMATANPAVRRNMERRHRVVMFELHWWSRVFPWMKHPFLNFITGFWVGLIDEGPYAMLKPRWGGLTFGWLNDGIKPTVWHTVWGLFHGQDDKWTGIYTQGAPRSKKEALLFDEHYDNKHDTDLTERRGYPHGSGKDMDCRLCLAS